MGTICTKVKYASKKMGDQDLKRIQKSSSRSTIPIRVYKCLYCKGWHLTSRPDIFALKKEIEILRLENANLKMQVKQYVKNPALIIKADARIIQLENTIANYLKRVTNLENRISDLLERMNKMR